ncbi:hypothetical protein YUMDRAFT_03587, partial [Streptomyces sp. OspMP-M45]
AADPFVRGGPGYAHLRGNVRDWTAREDSFDQDPPAVNSQPGITVGHEDLRVRCSVDTSTTPEVFVMIKPHQR